MPSADPLLYERFIQHLLSSNSGIFNLLGIHPDNQECSLIAGEAEAPERLRHSLKVTQHAAGEMRSAFPANISQNVSAQIWRQLFGKETEFSRSWPGEGRWGGSLAEPSAARRGRGLCISLRGSEIFMSPSLLWGKCSLEDDISN